MKRLCILFSLFAAISLFNSCGDAELPYDLDSIRRGALIDVSKVTGSQQYVDFYDPSGTLNIRLQTVPHAEGEFDYIQLMLVFNRGQANASTHIIEDNIKTLPVDFSIDFSEILSLLGKTDVQPGETYDFTVNVVLKDGFVIYGWTKYTGFNNTQFAGYRVNGRPYSSAARYAVQASFQYDEWDSNVNNFEVHEVFYDGSDATYDVVVEHLEADDLPTGSDLPSGVNPENLRGVLIRDLWSTGTSTKVWVNTDNFSLVIPNQNVFPSWHPTYGSIWFEDVLPTANINTLTNVMEFNAVPTLPESGLFWGGAATFTIRIKDGVKSSPISKKTMPFNFVEK